jgi:hypothetical protein
VSTILMIALEIIVTPILATHVIPFFLNGQRLVVGLTLDQLRPAGLAAGNAQGPGPAAVLSGGRGVLDRRLVGDRYVEDGYPRRMRIPRECEIEPAIARVRLATVGVMFQRRPVRNRKLATVCPTVKVGQRRTCRGQGGGI